MIMTAVVTKNSLKIFTSERVEKPSTIQTVIQDISAKIKDHQVAVLHYSNHAKTWTYQSSQLTLNTPSIS